MRSTLLKLFSVFAILPFLMVVDAHGAELTPDQTVRVVIYTPPGGPADVVLRLMGQRVTELGGPRLLVEAKTGGGGTVAAAAVKQATPDGRTLLLGDMAMFSVNPTMIDNLSYETKDFKPVTLIYSFSTVLAVPASSPAKTVAELIAMSKTTPGGLSYGTQGPGSLGHLLGAMLFQVTNVRENVPVHYRGATPAATDLAAGQIHLVLGSYPGLLPFVEKNSVRILAVASKSRMSAIPQVPTLAEVGVPGVDLDYWFGLLAPAGTPDAIIRELNEAFVTAAKTPSIVQRLDELALTAVSSTPGEFAALMQSDLSRLAPVVRSLGVKFN